ETRLVIAKLAGIGAALSQGSPSQRAEMLRELVERVTIGAAEIAIDVRQRLLIAGTGADSQAESDTIVLSAPVEFRRRGVETKLMLPAVAEPTKPGRLDPALVKAIARGRLWFEELAAGQVASIQAIAEREGITARYIRRLLPLAFLAPEIVATIFGGRQPVDLTAERLTNRIDLPLDWTEQ